MTTARTVRRAVLALSLAVAALLPARPAQAQDPALLDPSKLATPALRRVQVPKPERYVMPNGVTVFLLENHDLPRIAGTAYFKSSPLWIPDEKVGLGGVTGEVMRSGGSAAHDGDWLDDRLAAIGASISSGLSSDMGSGGFRCLSDNTAEVLGLFAEVLRAPAFPEDKIELAKVGLRQSIASRNDEMIPLLIRVSMEAVYGKESPYARKPEYATVEAIGQADCRKLHAAVFRPDRMVLAIYGDFQPAQMKKLLAARFGDWKKGDASTVPPPPKTPAPAPRLVFAPKEDVTQSGIILAQLGFRADDPDYAAMNVLGMGLGGGFQSRLVNKIRTERGLAYASGAQVGADYMRPGVFIAYSLTRTDSALTALDLLRQETTRVTQEPFTVSEMGAAKSSVLNGLVFDFADPAAVLFRSAYYELAGYPLDFLERYQKSLEAVDAPGVLEAAKRKIHPEQFVAIVVGKEKEFEKPLEAMGLPVERVDISIPPPASKLKVGESSPEALAEGQALLRKAADLAGGSTAWAGIKAVSLTREATLTMQGQTIPMTNTTQWRLPDRYVSRMKLAMGEIVQGFDGTAGWMSAMGQMQEQPKAGEEIRKEYERSMFRLFGAPGDFQVQALPEPRTVDGVACKVALVKSDVVRDWLLFFAPDGSLHGMEYQGQNMAGAPAKTTQVYGDWRAAGGIRYPYAEKMLVDDQPMMDGKITSLDLNPTLGDDIFKKPAQ